MTPDQLSDRAEINDLINRYGEGVRLRDIDMLASCFSDDAVLDYGPTEVAGTEAIRAFFSSGSGGATSESDRPVHALDERVASTPVMSNVMVELHGDEAHCESMCLAIHAGFAAGRGLGGHPGHPQYRRPRQDRFRVAHPPPCPRDRLEPPGTGHPGRGGPLTHFEPSGGLAGTAREERDPALGRPTPSDRVERSVLAPPGRGPTRPLVRGRTLASMANYSSS